jgi:fimbrial chaperone protein
MQLRRCIAATCGLAAIPVLFLTGVAARAQSLSVMPVNIYLAPGQSATTLTVTNQGTTKTSVQIRAFGWNQQGDGDQLVASDAVVVSPPIASIDPGASQVVRLILRQAPQGREATYRILVDQIPPPAEPGIVHLVLRLSIPIFAEPATRAFPQLQFHVEVDGGQMVLVGSNDGLRHEAIRDIEVLTSDGRRLKAAPGSSPYILAGSTRRWNISVEGPLPAPGDSMQMTGHSDAGAIKEQIHVLATH